MNCTILILFFGLLMPANGKPVLTEDQKIDRLITYVRSLKDVTFIRNGSEYSSKKAAEHLESKRKYAGKNIKSARQFIKDIASKSSMTGKTYQIRFKDGKTYPSETIFTRELERIEKEQK
jgi:hypothetical protein